ncbi:hypothetical protein [Candidatus Sulfuricurvum sp. RIFRC-1]|uniref:hypothetical protein n=1 Tax=Candidatus Sulfuricurvum sp. RIFRC-1 TaxID=1249480 RepID=UPI00344ED8A0
MTALLARILPVSFETLILYMPSFLGSLIVIPLILIGRALNQTTRTDGMGTDQRP